MRDDYTEKPCISFSAREVQLATKPAEAQVEEDKGAWPFGPAPISATEGWSTHPPLSTPHAEPDVSFGGQVADRTSNLCYMFGITDDEKPVENALMASSSSAITSQNSVNSNPYSGRRSVRPLLVRRHHRRLQATSAGLRSFRYAPLDYHCRGSSAGRYGNQILVQADIVVVPGIGRNPFLVTTSAKEGIATISDYETSGWRGSTSRYHYGARAATSARSC